MSEHLSALIGALLINNFVLIQFLGIGPVMLASHHRQSALVMAGATLFVLPLSLVGNLLLMRYVLVPNGLDYLDIIVFTAVVLVLAYAALIIVRRGAGPHHRSADGPRNGFLPLLISSCAVLGASLLQSPRRGTVLDALLYGLAAAMGFVLVMLTFTALRERVDRSDVPAPFRGLAIGMITVGLMSLAFMGFAGMGAG